MLEDADSTRREGADAPPEPGPSSWQARFDARPQTPSRPLPPRTPRPRVPLTRETLPERAESTGDPELSAALRRLWDETAEESVRLAERLSFLAPYWAERDADPRDDVLVEDLAVALALRVPEPVAYRMIRDAHIAVTHLPGLHARLAAGELPASWMTHALRAVLPLTPAQRREVDATASEWEYTVLPERFRTRLGQLITRARTRDPLPEDAAPRAQRRVSIFAVEHEEGMACLSVVGPAPEITALGVRLDGAARAVQAAQRQALAALADPQAEDPAQIPFDDAPVLGTGRPMTLARLRYDILTTSLLTTDPVRVPAERFRVSVTVPVTTLLGDGHEPGLLDGTISIPAQMACELAAGESTWYRILTDPVTGAILPVTANRYQPTPRMLEHLRARQATCAVPGCPRPVSRASECDHIREFDHGDPAAGGTTTAENLHLLCWAHHDDKTAGLIDPERLSTGDRTPGATRWTLPGGTRVTVEDDTDLFTPEIAERLAAHWRLHERLEDRRRRNGRRPDDPGGPELDGAVDPGCGDSSGTEPGSAPGNDGDGDPWSGPPPF